jgi:predicted nucleotidyltransferase
LPLAKNNDMTTPFVQALEDLSHHYGLAAVYAFGSLARAALERVRAGQGFTAPPESDLDIAVLPQPKRRLSARELVDLTAALEDLFTVRRVDLVVLPEVKPFLALEAVRGELLLALDEDAEAEYELYVLRRAGDLAEMERERRELALEER